MGPEGSRQLVRLEAGYRMVVCVWVGGVECRRTCVGEDRSIRLSPNALFTALLSNTDTSEPCGETTCLFKNSNRQYTTLYYSLCIMGLKKAIHPSTDGHWELSSTTHQSSTDGHWELPSETPALY